MQHFPSPPSLLGSAAAYRFLHAASGQSSVEPRCVLMSLYCELAVTCSLSCQPKYGIMESVVSLIGPFRHSRLAQKRTTFQLLTTFFVCFNADFQEVWLQALQLPLVLLPLHLSEPWLQPIPSPLLVRLSRSKHQPLGLSLLQCRKLVLVAALTLRYHPLRCRRHQCYRNFLCSPP
jgi:hypothetical protein